MADHDPVVPGTEDLVRRLNDLKGIHSSLFLLDTLSRHIVEITSHVDDTMVWEKYEHILHATHKQVKEGCEVAISRVRECQHFLEQECRPSVEAAIDQLRAIDRLLDQADLYGVLPELRDILNQLKAEFLALHQKADKSLPLPGPDKENYVASMSTSLGDFIRALETYHRKYLMFYEDYQVFREVLDGSFLQVIDQSIICAAELPNKLGGVVNDRIETYMRGKAQPFSRTGEEYPWVPRKVAPHVVYKAGAKEYVPCWLVEVLSVESLKAMVGSASSNYTEDRPFAEIIMGCNHVEDLASLRAHRTGEHRFCVTVTDGRILFTLEG